MLLTKLKVSLHSHFISIKVRSHISLRREMFSSPGAPRLGFVLGHSKCLDVVWVQPLRTQRTPTGDDVGEPGLARK